MPKSYTQLLRDPRWQKKRLEIMQRDDFTCVSCGDSEQTLNVHHCYYYNNKEPWDYEDESLVTLCELCHGVETLYAKENKNALVRAFAAKGFLSDDFERLAMAVYHSDFATIGYPNEVRASIIAFAIESEDFRETLLNCFWEETSKRARKIKEASHESA